MIYLDNAATTRVFDSAVIAAEKAMRDEFYNPNTTYKSGVKVRDSIENSRKYIAEKIGAYSDELVFTSCATESNNWVFNCGIKNKKGNIVISAGEHSSVYESAMQLKSRGCDIRIAPLDKNGGIDETRIYDLVDDNTALLSVIHVSNETGVINPIKRIAENIRKLSPKTLIHSDGVQGFIKTGDSLHNLGIDYYSASAHKIGAPKGIGLLYIKRGLGIAPYICGGGQERGLRSGTQNTPYIAAFAAAVEQFDKLADGNRMHNLRNDICDYFVSNGCKIIGDTNNSGYIICVCIPNAKAEIVQNLAHDSGVIVGKGAACSGSKRGNRVLSAIGLSDKEIECCVRISLFADTERDDAMNAVKIILDSANKIRSNHVG